MQKRDFESEVRQQYTGHDIFSWMAGPMLTRKVHETCRLKVTDTV